MADPSPPSPPPARTWALVCYAGIAAVTCSSFAGCLMGTHDNGWRSFANIAGPVCGIVTLCLTICAIVIFARNIQGRDTWPSIVGMLFSIGYGFGSMAIDLLLWESSGRGGYGFGVGGWGRPLRVGGKTLTPGVKASREWAKGPRPDPSELDAQTRAVLRELWLHDARKEHASVPAFGQVARQLVVLGAPSDLVKRAHLSCLQEIDHAERCFALASTYAGEDLGVQAMPDLARGSGELPRDRMRALVQVATEALVDGALLEDFNAELARTALDDVRDPAAHEALVRIVEDEADHARLAWDIIAFCVREGGAPVARALEARFAKVADRIDSLYEPELEAMVAALPDHTPLYAHGRVRPDRVEAVYLARRAFVTKKLGGILSETARAPSPARRATPRSSDGASPS